jgi:hypothetical protein
MPNNRIILTIQRKKTSFGTILDNNTKTAISSHLNANSEKANLSLTKKHRQKPQNLDRRAPKTKPIIFRTVRTKNRPTAVKIIFYFFGRSSSPSASPFNIYNLN